MTARRTTLAALHEIGEPRIVEGEVAAAQMPALVRFLAGRFGLHQYVLVRRISG